MARDWRGDYLYAFAAVQDEATAFATADQLVRDLGFEYASYGLRVALPVSNPKFSLHSSYDKGWALRYVERNYFSVDPTVRHGLTSTEIMVWSADSSIEAGPKEFWSEAHAHKLRHGLCIPVQTSRGINGMMSFVRSAEPMTNLELDAKELRLQYLTRALHTVISQIAVPKLMPESALSLTARERDVLRWTATGKTSHEIGLILAIDERTVKFHMRNSMSKLNSATRTEAAVKAAKLGLLD